jgi:uncharacterized membrane protein YjfL (UPF0719 family)
VIHVLLGVGELLLSVALVVLALALSYRLFGRLVLDLDGDGELKKGNLAAAIVLVAVMVCPAAIVLSTMGTMVFLARSFFLHGREDLSAAQLGLYGLCWVLLVLALSLFSMWLALRLFDRLTPGLDELDEVRKGNVAVAVLMAGVIAIVSVSMQEGISTLSRTLVPRTPLGELKMMR